jgi:plasmid segregation protein ParM
MSIIGIDVGYKNTKIYSKFGEDLFSSTIREGVDDFNKGIQVSIDGKDYTVGEATGKVSVKLDKINDETFRVCLYTAIARTMKDYVDNNVILVTGLPIDYYKSQKDELIKSLKGVKVTMTYNGTPKTFTIQDVLVFPQSAGLMVLEPEKFKGDNLVVDIGGLTVCVSYFKNLSLLKHKTYELGMLKLYDKLIQNIKSIHKVSYDPLQAEDIIKNKKIIIDGEAKDITDLVNTTLKQHTTEILEAIELGLTEYQTSIRFFIGGGSTVLKPYLKGTFIEQSIYTNAKAYYKLGVSKYES